MKNIQNKKKIQIMIFVLIAVITLGVGYAAISAINLVINGNATGSVNQENFKVKFTTAAVTTGTGTAGIDTNDPKVATFNVTGLTKVGDTAIASYTVLNDSPGIGASISLDLTNSNTEYFSVTEAIGDTELQAGDTTTATITVTMVKTPIESAVTTSITGTLIASPLENASATGSASASVIPAISVPYKYSLNGNYIGQPIEYEFTNFEEGNGVISTAHIITGGVIEKSYVAFKKDGTVYYLQGDVNSSLSNTPIYDANVEVLKTAYGSNWANYCTESIVNHDGSDEPLGLKFECNSDNIQAYVTTFQEILVSVSNADLEVFGDCRIEGTRSSCGFAG